MLSLKRLYNNTISISRKQQVEDNHGGFDTKWNKIANSIPCRLYSLSGNSPTSGLKISIEGNEYSVTDKLIVTRDSLVKEGDTIQDDNNSETFLVLRVKRIFTLKSESHKEVLLSRTDGENL